MNLKKNYIWHKFSEFANVLIYKEKVAKMTTLQNVAGVAGFEPTNVGTKSRCLTTWRHPNIIVKNVRINEQKYFYTKKI